MIEQLLDISMIILYIPLLAVLSYIYKRSRYNTMLIMFGASIIILLAHVLNAASYTGPVLPGVYWFPSTFIFLSFPIIMSYYLIKDHMWTLLSVLMVLSFIMVYLMLAISIPSHGVFTIPMAAIIYAWFKESKRCFNPIVCPVMQLESRYLKGGDSK